MSDEHGTTRALALPEEQGERKMHPVVAAALERGLDVQQLGEIIRLQREWETAEAAKAYDRAMVELKRDLPAVLARDQMVHYESKKPGAPPTHYTHTSLAAAVEAVIDPLTAHGFTHRWTTEQDDRNVVVTCTLKHSEGHSEHTVLRAPPDTSGQKSPAQAVASTATLLSRYTLLLLLGIATADMREPTGEQPEAPEAVDQQRNLQTAVALRSHGKSRGEAEQYLDKPLAEWTAADRRTLRAWVLPEPGDDSGQESR